MNQTAEPERGDARWDRNALIRADVAARAGIDFGDAPGGGPVTWWLTVDDGIAVTDEPMTDQAAVEWASRMLARGVVFAPWRLGGGFWLSGPGGPRPDRVPEPFPPPVTAQEHDEAVRRVTEWVAGWLR